MISKISFLCPTRERPNNIDNLLSSLVNTTDTKDELEIIFRLDTEDVPTLNHILSIPEFPFKRFIIIGPNLFPVSGEMYNECFRLCTGELIMAGADDLHFHTQGWDTMVRKRFDEMDKKIGLVYGRDDIQNGHMATHPIVHRNWITTLGYFLPSHHGFCQWNDTWITHIADIIHRKYYLPELHIEHLHYSNRKSNPDYLYTRNTSRIAIEEPLYNSLQNVRHEDANKLLKFIEGTT